MAVYLMGVYSDEADAAWFRERWLGTGHRLDMAKSCVRFRRLDDVPLDVIGEAVARTSVDEFLRRYEASRAELSRNGSVRAPSGGPATHRG